MRSDDGNDSDRGEDLKRHRDDIFNQTFLRNRGVSLSLTNQIAFPVKLYQMLEDMSASTGERKVVSWSNDGTSFRCHDPKKFVTDVMPHYFRQSKYKSFQRQLHLYGFQRQIDGFLKGYYSHPEFHRSNRGRCAQMMPLKRKAAASTQSGSQTERDETDKEIQHDQKRAKPSRNQIQQIDAARSVGSEIAAPSLSTQVNAFPSHFPMNFSSPSSRLLYRHFPNTALTQLAGSVSNTTSRQTHNSTEMKTEKTISSSAATQRSPLVPDPPNPTAQEPPGPEFSQTLTGSTSVESQAPRALAWSDEAKQQDVSYRLLMTHDAHHMRSSLLQELLQLQQQHSGGLHARPPAVENRSFTVPSSHVAPSRSLLHNLLQATATNNPVGATLLQQALQQMPRTNFLSLIQHLQEHASTVQSAVTEQISSSRGSELAGTGMSNFASSAAPSGLSLLSGLSSQAFAIQGNPSLSTQQDAHLLSALGQQQYRVPEVAAQLHHGANFSDMRGQQSKERSHAHSAGITSSHTHQADVACVDEAGPQPSSPHQDETENGARDGDGDSPNTGSSGENTLDSTIFDPSPS